MNSTARELHDCPLNPVWLAPADEPADGPADCYELWEYGDDPRREYLWDSYQRLAAREELLAGVNGYPAAMIGSWAADCEMAEVDAVVLATPADRFDAVVAELIGERAALLRAAGLDDRLTVAGTAPEAGEGGAQ